MLKLSFYGGAGEVGRNCFLLQDGNDALLLDAGVKLGLREEYPLISDAQIRSLRRIAISHTHLDHIGFLPFMYRKGCRAKIFATKPTQDMTKLLLEDYLRIKQDRERRAHHKFPAEKHDFGEKDVAKALKQFTAVEYGQEVGGGKMRFSFHNAGHILGSAITLVRGSKRVLYTADINLRETILLDPAQKGLAADVLITEATYGGKADRIMPVKEAREKLVKSIAVVLKKGGKVLIPSFAVGRGQEIMFILETYMRSGALPKVPIYIDGMILKANRIYRQNVIDCRREIQKRILIGNDDPFKSPLFREPSATKKEVYREGPAIIVTTSGMMSGGPVIDYFKRLAGDPRNKLILVGYQAEGTLGRRLLEGEREIGFQEELIRVKIPIENISLSAHADHAQLVEFARSVKGLKKVFVIHGDGEKTVELAAALRRPGLEVIIPKNGESYNL